MSILDWFLKRKKQPATTPALHEKPTATTEPPTGGTSPGPASDAPTLQITGDWLNQVWKEKPVQVFAEADAAMAFLSQEELPYLWEDEQGFIDRVDAKPDPQRELRKFWTAAYLSHPEWRVIRRTLRDHVTPELLDTSAIIMGFIPFFMIHLDSGVREGAASKLWECKLDATIRSVFGVFSGKYLGHATVPYDKYTVQGEYKQSAKAIVTTLREHCPPKWKELFEEQVFEVFPSLAERDAPKVAGEVKFKEKETKERMGVTQTYEVHTADSKADALVYLGKKTVAKANYYVIIETPEGNWGKDMTGVFEE